MAFDREKATTQMKSLYGKAAAARKEGKRAQALSFRAGGDRLKRAIAVDLRKNPPKAEKTEE